ncbi:MAG TPA: TIGR03084 family metal-binding protein [Nocardioidaceae bacterium]|nr:TIGR03084 family metal-binding protein [Nocardioidaceae bacterium]
MSRLEAVLADLEVISERLDALVVDLPESEWRRATPAAGWDIAHQVAHLAWTDECAVVAATDGRAWDRLVREAMADPEGFVDRGAAHGAQHDGSSILSRWRESRQQLAQRLRAFPAGEKVPWYGPPMRPASMATARFMETWAHSRDVADALGVTLPVDDRVVHVCHIGVRARGFSFANNGQDPPAADIRVELTLPGGGTFADGPTDAEQSVRGSAYHFALLVTQRAHRDDLDLVATGADAETWLDLAQAFAGPSGIGRQPRMHP